MTTIHSIDVDCPIDTVYDQWTQFEEFPYFMEGVREVRQLDDARLHWVAQIAGVEREWEAQIVEQRPAERIAWRSTTGAANAGTVSFQAIEPDRTRVTLDLEFEPEGAVEQIGDKLGFIDRRAEGDLVRFKEFIESRGQATGAWRGEIPQGDEPGFGPRP